MYHQSSQASFGASVTSRRGNDLASAVGPNYHNVFLYADATNVLNTISEKRVADSSSKRRLQILVGYWVQFAIFFCKMFMEAAHELTDSNSSTLTV